MSDASRSIRSRQGRPVEGRPARCARYATSLPSMPFTNGLLKQRLHETPIAMSYDVGYRVSAHPTVPNDAAQAHSRHTAPPLAATSYDVASSRIVPPALRYPNRPTANLQVGCRSTTARHCYSPWSPASYPTRYVGVPPVIYGWTLLSGGDRKHPSTCGNPA